MKKLFKRKPGRSKLSKILIIEAMLCSLMFLGGCDIITDFIQKPIGWIVIGGITLYCVFKYGGKK